MFETPKTLVESPRNVGIINVQTSQLPTVRQFEGHVAKMKDTCLKLPFLSPGGLPPHSPMLLGNCAEIPKAATILPLK